MKFGKHLQRRQLDIPEYAASFVNYKALKKLIKQLSATPPILPRNASTGRTETVDPQGALQANKATFFFRLERELEKVNAFYVQKEAELKVRLKTLLDKKKVIQARGSTTSKLSATFISLEEGFQQFCNDLNKLQQFIDINNTAFSKILKKWDKTSKSRTKELYLSRAVEAQPCFNRDVISALSDQATTSLQELGAWAEGENIRSDEDSPSEHAVSGQPIGAETDDTDAQILQAVNVGNTPALQDWIGRLQTSTDGTKRFTRIFLSAVSDAPEDSLTVLLASGLVDVQAEDDITGRNCLHEAAISGRESILQVGLEAQINVARVDVYGRIPLHYACMFGRVNLVRVVSSIDPGTINAMDHDNFTPLIHAIAKHQLECVQELLGHGVRLDPVSESDHVPLNLACQYGSTAIAELLLHKGAQLLSDAEGLYPQHLVARSGETPATLLLLEQYGANLDQHDKLYQWTPLFHAASEGRFECLNLLLQKGADRTIQDEKGYSAMYYAAWEGHLECMRLLGFGDVKARDELMSQLSQVLSSSAYQSPPAMPTTTDGIPDLSLPPPIIPLRRYGHNFLDSKILVQINFISSDSDAILFYHDSKYPAARLTISSKSSDVIPRNIMLPIQEDTRTISFQVNSLRNFSVDFDIYPTFGSRMIARSVALPSLFGSHAHSSGHCCLPMFDPRLRAIGQVSFDFHVIQPFQGMALDIANFATYWRVTSQLDTHPNGLITGSSLSGNYVQLFVQVTKDGISVLYPHWSIDCQGVHVPISRLTYEQCSLLINRSTRRHRQAPSLTDMTGDYKAEIHRYLASSCMTLRDALDQLSTDIHINLNVIFPTVAQERVLDLGPSQNISTFVDAILLDVFDHARSTKEQSPGFVRSIVFSSFNADVCTALNWKQPNYPVLLCNNLGAMQDPETEVSQASKTSDGHNSISVKEAVRIAQCNNFMGLVCNSRLLTMVPLLIESIKMAGLVLVMDASGDGTVSEPARRDYRMPEGVDGILRSNGILKFNEMVDM